MDVVDQHVTVDVVDQHVRNHRHHVNPQISTTSDTVPAWTRHSKKEPNHRGAKRKSKLAGKEARCNVKREGEWKRPPTVLWLKQHGLSTHAHIHTHTLTHTHTHTHTHARGCTHTHTRMGVRTRAHAHTHTYINTYMHACMHTYIHTYIHTHTPFRPFLSRPPPINSAPLPNM